MNHTLDERLSALSAWAAHVLKDSDCSLRPASEDASFRRYYRVQTASGATYIAMDAPPEKEDCRPWIRIARAFRGVGLNVPEIFAVDEARGFLLISDLGDRLYLGALTEVTVDGLYQDAMAALLALQAGGSAHIDWLPAYDARLLRFEMELFREWYLARHLGLELSANQNAVLDTVFDLLTTSALEQPRVVVHRDYHSRNLLVTESNNPGILDFQDAVIGPITYDLVSLLRDCYIAWPQARVETWACRYRELALRSGVSMGPNDSAFLRWFDLMGVQRHLKAIGIFARLNYRDGKPNYLSDIPRVLSYVGVVARRYPELGQLAKLVEDTSTAEVGERKRPV